MSKHGRDINCTEATISGGFCVSNATVDNTYCTSRALATLLAQKHFLKQRVLDLGCGAGGYGKLFLARPDLNISWLGIDGAANIESATKSFVRYGDLSTGIPSYARQPWDWVMSLEVAEHVPRGGEARFMHNLVSLAQVGIVLSWANLGQMGHQHVNCQSGAYVTCMMHLLGWQHSTRESETLRHGTIVRPCDWLKSTIRIFRPNASQAVWRPLPETASNSFIETYMKLSRERCGYLRGGCARRYFAHTPDHLNNSEAFARTARRLNLTKTQLAEKLPQEEEHAAERRSRGPREKNFTSGAKL